MAYKPKQKDKKEVAEIISKISQRVKQLEKLPNAKNHKNLSFIKSGIRILGYISFLVSIELAVGVLIVSEVIGILEELV
tara:strand:- start:33 stop:269 length:237 start_codon:yes stop_codon:yes gene_type:complete